MSKIEKHRKPRASSFKFEAFLLNYGLQTAGILLILGGLVYLFSSNLHPHFLAELWNSITKPHSSKSVIVSSTGTSTPGYLSLLLYLPGILLLAITYFFRNGKPRLKNILVSIGFILLIFSEVKVMAEIRSHQIELNYYLLLASFCITQIIATAISIAGRNRSALNWSIGYFFASIILIRLIYGVIIPNIIFLIFFQMAVSLCCFIYKWRSPFILLMTLSLFYISYYFIKLIILPGDASASLSFMLPGLLVWFILSVSGFGILKTDSTIKYLTYTWNFLPYVTLSIVIGLLLGYYFKSGVSFPGLLYYALAVTVLIVITLFDRKFAFIKYGDPFYLSVCIFAALLIPQLFYSNFLLVLLACLALAFLINVMLTGLKFSLQLSMTLFFSSLGVYLVMWIFKVIPAMVVQRAFGTLYPEHLIAGSLILFALSSVYYRLFTQMLKDFDFSYAQAKKYKNYVSSVYAITVYLTLFLILDYLLILLIPAYRVNFVEWGVFTYSFMFYLLIHQNEKSKTKLLYAFFATVPAVLLFPIVIHPETIHFRTHFLAGEPAALVPFIMHYFSLGALILILLHVNGRLRLLYPKSRFIVNTRMFLGIVFLCFILLSEYDHLLLLTLNSFSSRPAYEILQYNKFIPYSVILFLVSVALMVFSLIFYTRFLRRLSMVMILAVLLKVLFIDITILPSHTSIILLISLGALLVALSFLISRFRKQSTINKVNETS